MKIEKPQVAGYGLHYHANNQLIANVSDRTLFQCLIDIVRKQLAKSLDDQTIFVPLSKLARMSGLDAYRTVPACLSRLETLGLVRKHNNAITVMCDEYVSLVQHYESLPNNAKLQFAKNFSCKGVGILQECRIPVILQGRGELLGLSGSSITVGVAKTCNNVGFQESDVQNPTFLQGSYNNVGNVQECRSTPCNDVGFQDSEQQNPTFLQESYNIADNVQECRITAIMQENLQALAKILHSCRGICDFEEFCGELNPTFLQGDSFEFLKSAFLTGKLPESFKNEPKKSYIFAGCNPTFLQVLGSKVLHFCSTVISINKKENKLDPPEKNDEGEEDEEDIHEQIKKGFESFAKVEIIDLNQPSEDFEDVGASMEDKILKRAERTLRQRNPYKDKPFIPVKRVEEMVEALDEVVKSPVDFFIYNFWWGIYDLYCDHYQPSVKVDEEGEVIEDPQSYDWKEILEAPLPQDEVYNLAKNVYEDMEGAVEQGSYFYGDENNEWEVKFAFKSFNEFDPFSIFQWSPCTMQDKSIPALKVVIDKFYDIEAEDVYVPTKADRKVKNAQNLKLVNLLMAADVSQLTPLEKAIRKFYDTFVVQGEGGILLEYTDDKGVVLESGGRLPDHLLKPWCYREQDVAYDDFTSVFNTPYKPCDGAQKRATVFSADLVIRWNELHGYRDSISHKAIQ